MTNISSPVVGILGGGQLGRMLLQAAIDLDIQAHVLDPDPEASCRSLTPHFTVGSLKDFETVMAFGQACDYITIEIEDVNLDALEALEAQGKKVYPQPRVLRTIQNKRIQKNYFLDRHLPTSPFIPLEHWEAYTGPFPVVQKVETGGYDGRGVQVLRGPEDMSKVLPGPSFLEAYIPFEKELAVVVGRSATGEVATFPVVEMVFHPEANLVEYLFSPACISEELSRKAQKIAVGAAEALEVVGILAVEMFLLPSGEILINECAPRPHNSGHHTLRANDVSQFEQHWRAILGWPLGDTSAHCPAAMVNVLGSEGFHGPAIYEGLDEVLRMPGVHPFLYGKKITKPFRKMGHVTILGPDLESLREKVDLVQQHLHVKSSEIHG